MNPDRTAMFDLADVGPPMQLYVTRGGCIAAPNQAAADEVARVRGSVAVPVPMRRASAADLAAIERDRLVAATGKRRAA